jgi:outer membrane protein
MKITGSVITKSVLALLIAAGVSACNQNKTDSKPAAATTTGSEIAKQEIVYINQDSIVAKYDYIKDMDKRLGDKGKAAQSDLAGRKQAFQREVAEYQKSATTLSADQRAATEQRLQRKGEQLGETNKLYTKIADFAKEYAKEKGYKMILTYQKGNTTVLYGDPSLDVTAEVIKRLNEAYAKDKK